jgi:hypothetical protein
MAFTLMPSVGPFLELGTGFCADLDEVRVGKIHAGFASLLNINFVFVDVAQSKKDDPGQIALYSRLFGEGFAEIKRKAQRYARLIVRCSASPLRRSQPRRVMDPISFSLLSSCISAVYFHGRTNDEGSDLARKTGFIGRAM